MYLLLCFYFIDNTLSTDFTFLSDFTGCDNEKITPILVAPDESSYFCSDIPTAPAETPFLSTCPIPQTQIYSGNWLIVIEGLTFAYVRNFTITSGKPVQVTTTNTVTVGITSTPDASTSITTSYSTGSTVLPPATSTVPCLTLSLTSLYLPPPVTISTAKTISIVITTGIVFESEVSTSATLAECTPPPFPRKHDPKLQHPLRLARVTITPLSSQSKRAVADKLLDKREFRRMVERNMALQRRSPDQPTVAVPASVNVTVTSTTVVPAPTVTQSTIVTTITTSTPPAITKCKAVSFVTETVTLPTITYTRLHLTSTIIFVDKTISLVKTRKVTMTPGPNFTSCINGGGSI